MKRLGTRVNLIPVVAKADTLTPEDLQIFKQRVRSLFHSASMLARRSLIRSADFSSMSMQSLRNQIREVVAAQGIKIYTPPIEEDDAASADHARTLTNAMPFSIIGSTTDVQTSDGRTVKGREYIWGVAEGSFPSVWTRLFGSNKMLSRCFL
jgi:cell division control protein 12